MRYPAPTPGQIVDRIAEYGGTIKVPSSHEPWTVCKVETDWYAFGDRLRIRLEDGTEVEGAYVGGSANVDYSGQTTVTIKTDQGDHINVEEAQVIGRADGRSEPASTWSTRPHGGRYPWPIIEANGPADG